MSAIENVMVGRHLHERRNPLLHLLGLPGVRRQNELSMAKAASLLDFVGLPGVAQRPAGELPYGALKRLEIARALAVEPRVLLLDEPVAGCNAVESAEVAAVIRKVADTGVAVLLVEHDMHLVMQLADRIHVLERGRTLFEGTAQEVKSNPAVIEAYLGAPKKVEADHA
jgi:branched-chain amino acid transport system ATP-binding protein